MRTALCLLIICSYYCCLRLRLLFPLSHTHTLAQHTQQANNFCSENGFGIPHRFYCRLFVFVDSRGVHAFCELSYESIYLYFRLGWNSGRASIRIMFSQRYEYCGMCCIAFASIRLGNTLFIYVVCFASFFFPRLFSCHFTSKIMPFRSLDSIRFIGKMVYLLWIFIGEFRAVMCLCAWNKGCEEKKGNKSNRIKEMLPKRGTTEQRFGC